MTSQLKIVGVGLLGSLGLTFIILGCVMSGTWWTLLLFLFYGLTPLPLLFIDKDGYDNLDSRANTSKDIAIFFLTGIVVSTLAFPILLSHAPVDKPVIDFPNAFLAEFATVIFYVTAGLFFLASNEENE